MAINKTINKPAKTHGALRNCIEYVLREHKTEEALVYMTGQVLVNVARASVRQQPGCYTMVEIPVIDMLAGSREDLIKHLV